MSTPTTEISSLISLITDAARSIESYYKANGEKVPSLDDAQPHPLDDVPYPSNIRNDVQILEGACLQLCATVSRPGHTMLNVSYRFSKLSHCTSLNDFFLAILECR